MENIKAEIEKLIEKIGNLVPEYSAVKEDSFSDGNVAVCIIDEEENVYGKLWGTDKIRSRQTYNIAWKKASQVWITGMKTGEFEKKVFNKEIDEHEFGISMPDFIGWIGGQPITLKDGTKISAGFSGFRGISDIEIVLRALKAM